MPRKTQILLPERLSRGDARGYLAAVAIVRDEAPYLREWVAFHLLSGVEHVYIYDNHSTDDIESQIEPFVTKGSVTCLPWPYPWYITGSLDAQQTAFADAVTRFGGGWRWMAFIDVDEFLFAAGDEGRLDDLRAFLEAREKFPTLFAWWTMFGSNGHRSRPDGLVIENFPLHAPFPFLSYQKTICDPRTVRSISSPHVFDNELGRDIGFDEHGRRVRTTRKGSTPPSSDVLKLHHYYVRSTEDWERKVERRRGQWSPSKVAKLEERGRRLEQQSTVPADAVRPFIGPIRRILEALE